MTGQFSWLSFTNLWKLTWKLFCYGVWWAAMALISRCLIRLPSLELLNYFHLHQPWLWNWLLTFYRLERNINRLKREIVVLIKFSRRWRRCVRISKGANLFVYSKLMFIFLYNTFVDTPSSSARAPRILCAWSLVSLYLCNKSILSRFRSFSVKPKIVICSFRTRSSFNSTSRDTFSVIVLCFSKKLELKQTKGTNMYQIRKLWFASFNYSLHLYIEHTNVLIERNQKY